MADLFQHERGGGSEMMKRVLRECGRLAICELPAIVMLCCGAWWWAVVFALGGAMVWSR